MEADFVDFSAANLNVTSKSNGYEGLYEEV